VQRIHPSNFIRLSGVGSWRQQVQERNPDIPLPSNTPEAFSGQRGHIIPPTSPGSAPGPPPSRTCPKKPPKEATRRHPYQMPEPPQLTFFDAEEQWL